MPTYSLYQQVETILSAAFDEICMMAQEVGIDGCRLLNQSHLTDGCLLKGTTLPIVDKGYKGRCYVVFKIFRTYSGDYWPYLKFCTFRHGGMERIFNGYQWLQRHRYVYFTSSSLPDISVMSSQSSQKVLKQSARDQAAREKRHASLTRRYQESRLLEADHRWVLKRFPGIDKHLDFTNIPVRVCGAQLLVPITNPSSEVVGYHEITPHLHDESKRHYVKRMGAMKGGFILLPGVNSKCSLPPIMCEGLATGISLSLCTNNCVFVALSANNLLAVRLNITDQSILICYDNDLWGKDQHNPGHDMALHAQQQQDVLCGPRFNESSALTKPTDFNDLHQLEGIQVLRQQLQSSVQ